MGVVANNGSYAQKLVPENSVMLNRHTCMCYASWCVAQDTITVCRNLWDYQLHSQTVPYLHVPPYIHINNTAYPSCHLCAYSVGSLSALVLLSICVVVYRMYFAVK